MVESTSQGATTGHSGGNGTHPASASPQSPASGRVLCPYCGHTQPASPQCEQCKGLFEPLSRQATQNAMGPWQVRNERNPFGPGCSYAKLREMVARGKVTRETIIRGPSTRQFWTVACNAPGVAVLMGECHACHTRVDPDDYMCKRCGTVLTYQADRQHLGLAPIKLLPWEASPAEVASSGLNLAEQRPASPTVAQDEAWIEHTAEGRTLRVGGRSVAEPAGALSRPRADEPWRTMFIVLLAMVVLTGLIALVTVLTAEPAPEPSSPATPAPTAGPGPLQSTEQVLANLSGALGAIDELRAQDTEPSLRAASEALKSLINQAERDGHDGAADALRARLRQVEESLDAIELRKILGD